MSRGYDQGTCRHQNQNWTDPSGVDTILPLENPHRRRNSRMPATAAHGASPGWPSASSRVGSLSLGAPCSLYTPGAFTQISQLSGLIPSYPFDPRPYPLRPQRSSQHDLHLSTPPSFSSDLGFDDSSGPSQFSDSTLDTSLDSNFSMSSRFSAMQRSRVEHDDLFGLSTGAFDDGYSSGLLHSEANELQIQMPPQCSSLRSSSSRFEELAPFGAPDSERFSTPVLSFGDMSLFDESELDGSLTPESSLTRRRRSSFSASKLDDMKSLGSTKREREQSRRRFNYAPQDRSAKRSRGSDPLLHLNTSVGVPPYGTEGNSLLGLPDAHGPYSAFDQEPYD